MPWIIIVILVVLLTFAVQIYRFLFPFAFGIEQFLGLLLRPVDKLTDLFLRRESGLPGAKFIRFIILGIVLVASVIFIFTSLSSGTTFDDISDIMLGSTSIGQLFAFFGEERFGSTVKEQFTFTALVSLGLSSFLSFLYMRCTIETIEDFGMPGRKFSFCRSVQPGIHLHFRPAFRRDRRPVSALDGAGKIARPPRPHSAAALCYKQKGRAIGCAKEIVCY